MFNFFNVLDKFIEDIYFNVNLYCLDNVVRFYVDYNYIGYYIDIENLMKFLYGFNDIFLFWIILYGWFVWFYEYGDY